MHTQIDTLIFDLGKVLIEWEPRDLYRKIFDTEKEMEYFLSEVCTMDWNELQDGGRPLEEAMNLLIPQFPQYEKEIRAYYGRWLEMLGGSIKGTEEILTRFYKEKKYKLYALTNWSAETFPHALARFHFLEYFKGILVSGAVKLKKPDPRIYQMILDRYNLTAQKCLFIDDSLRNIKAAQAMGIQTIHFISPEQLQMDLDKMGI